MTVERHSHGTSARYAHGPAGDGVDPCREACCREAHGAAQRRRGRLRAAGRPTTVDPSEARVHVTSLHKAGVAPVRIAKLAGVPANTVRRLLALDAEPTQKTLHAHTARRLLAVTVTIDDLPDGAAVPADGARRRIQAAVAAGHPLSVVAVEMGVTFAQVHAIAHGHRRQVRVGTARAACALIDRLWLRPPATTTAEDRRLVTRARTMATREGWVPIAAWDEDTIDRPGASPAGARRDPGLERDVARLLADALPVAEIARRLNRNQRVVSKVRDRIRREQEEAA